LYPPVFRCSRLYEWESVHSFDQEAVTAQTQLGQPPTFLYWNQDGFELPKMQ
jgi:hypothetical protein